MMDETTKAKAACWDWFMQHYCSRYDGAGSFEIFMRLPTQEPSRIEALVIDAIRQGKGRLET